MRGKISGDAEALEALIQGREEGLDHYFNRYYASLAYFAHRLVDDPFGAEDLAAEAFVKLWVRRTQLSAVGSVKAWLYAAVRNASIDHLRKAKRLRESEANLPTRETIEQSVLCRMIEAETVRQIIRSLEVLPPGCRQVFKMFYIGGKSYREIALELRISPHTVRNQCARAVRLLKEKMT